MSTKRSKKREVLYDNIEFLNGALIKNGYAIKDGPEKKKWTVHDMKNIKPLNDTQREMMKQYFSGQHICAYGSAGTGKSLVSLYLAFCDVFNTNQPQERIIIVRSAVPTRELGYMPGTLEEKIAHYETPYQDIISFLFNGNRHNHTYEQMKKAGLITFMTTSFVRGLNWDDAVVIVDEGQNMTWEEINSIMTRIGKNTRVIFAGDLKQTDLNTVNNRKAGISGMQRFLRVIDEMKVFSSIEFNVNDIVRSEFVKSWIIASERIDK